MEIWVWPSNSDDRATDRDDVAEGDVVGAPPSKTKIASEVAALPSPACSWR